MIRPVARKDLPGLLELLRHMDQSPERGVLAPEARDLEGLAEELEDGLVLLEGEAVVGYVGLYPFWDGAALEGPLAYRKEDLPPLLKAAEERAKELGVERLYAFPREENHALREVLEGAGYDLLHLTYFFVKNPEGLDYPTPEGVRIQRGFPGPEVYRELYRESEEGWALRLKWTDEELQEHFQHPAVHLLVAYRGKSPWGWPRWSWRGRRPTWPTSGSSPRPGARASAAPSSPRPPGSPRRGGDPLPGAGPPPREEGLGTLPQPGL